LLNLVFEINENYRHHHHHNAKNNNNNNNVMVRNKAVHDVLRLFNDVLLYNISNKINNNNVIVDIYNSVSPCYFDGGDVYNNNDGDGGDGDVHDQDGDGGDDGGGGDGGDGDNDDGGGGGSGGDGGDDDNAKHKNKIQNNSNNNNNDNNNNNNNNNRNNLSNKKDDGVTARKSQHDRKRAKRQVFFCYFICHQILEIVEQHVDYLFIYVNNYSFFIKNIVNLWRCAIMNNFSDFELKKRILRLFLFYFF